MLFLAIKEIIPFSFGSLASVCEVVFVDELSIDLMLPHVDDDATGAELSPERCLSMWYSDQLQKQRREDAKSKNSNG
jgi:hypothetical protein